MLRSRFNFLAVLVGNGMLLGVGRDEEVGTYHDVIEAQWPVDQEAKLVVFMMSIRE